MEAAIAAAMDMEDPVERAAMEEEGLETVQETVQEVPEVVQGLGHPGSPGEGSHSRRCHRGPD